MPAALRPAARAAALGLASTLVLVAGCTGGPDDDEGAEDASGASGADASAGPPVDVQGSPTEVAGVGDAAWVVQPERRSVWREDADPVPVPGEPVDLVETPFGVWVVLADGVDGSLVRLDATTGAVEQRVSLTRHDTAPTDVAYDGQRLWILDQARVSAVLVDPATGDVGRRILVDGRPQELGSGAAGTFATGQLQAPLLALVDDPEGVYLAAEQVCTYPGDLAVGVGLVWVACSDAGRVVAVAPGAPGPELSVGLERPDDVLLTSAGVVVALAEGPTLVLLDPDDGAERGRLRLGDATPPTSGGVELARVGDDVVVLHPGTEQLHRVALTELTG